MYRVHRLRSLVIRIVLSFEGKEFFSGTLLCESYCSTTMVFVLVHTHMAPVWYQVHGLLV